MPECPRCGASHEEHARFCSACGYHLGSASHAGPLELRKRVTVVFCDLVGSTRLGERLDPEPLATLLQRYFDLTASIFTEHGGAVREFIGDAVLAVFGVPASREDDALRALRATLDIRAALGDLNRDLDPDLQLRVRIGVNTGEVLAGRTSAGQPLLLGDALNVAARLERLAAPGTALIGDETYRASWGLAEAEAIGDVAVDGRRDPVRVYRLDALREARDDPPFVGRRHELAVLGSAFDRVVSAGTPLALLLSGDAGLGKSRLLREFQAANADRARFLTARCSSYGSTTFGVLARLLALGDGDGDPIASASGSLEGMLGGDPPPTIDEVASAAAGLLTDLARGGPVVLAVEDVHWGPASLRELFAAIVRQTHGPVLMMATARPEGSWDASGPADGWTLLRLGPLDGPDVTALIEAALPPGASDQRGNVEEMARGNPLFIVETIRSFRSAADDPAADGGPGVVPTTLHSLMDARLERLDPGARVALEPAAVAGEVVPLALLTRAVGIAGTLDPAISHLVRRAVLVPGSSGELAFSHPLVREAAYRSIPKRRRADLHLAVAEAWEEGFRHGSDDPDLVIGTHLSSAVACRSELHLVEVPDPLAARAARHLFDAGSRAYQVGDSGLAAELFQRAAGLLGPDEPLGAEARVQAASACAETGAWADAERWCDEASAYGRRHGDDVIRARADVARGWSWMSSLDPRMYDELPSMIASAIEVLDRAGDHASLALAWFVACVPPWNDLHADACIAALDRSVDHARRAGSRSLELEALSAQVPGWLRGPMPVEEALDRSAGLLGDADVTRRVRFRVELPRAELLGMLGRFDEAWEVMDGVDEMNRQMFGSVQLINVEFRYHLHEHAGDPEGALRVIDGWESGLPEPAIGFLQCLRARSYVELGRDEDALTALDASDRLMHPGDRAIRVYLAGLRGLIRVRAGEIPAGLEEARHGVELADHGDFAIERGDSRRWLAESLWGAGRSEEAVAVATDALSIYRQKGAVPWVERTEALLAGWATSIPG